MAALKLAPDQWDACLVERCGSDDDLRGRVRNLLDAHCEAGSFLQLAEADPGRTTDEPITERPGAVVGSYKLLEQIGEGGFGVVFVAEQQEPVRRKVALKLIKPGMDTRQVIARFKAERQALAIMDHPNIAKVFDAGATDSGRPYFVMELVRGIPITAYCDQNRLTPRERLDLFVTVCHAVQHAHQKGIIHRDIKPSNVLVTSHDGRAVPKVIDFGVAKAVNQQLTERAIHTQFAQMIGTPLYMSPEQAEMSGLDIDTRSDIYSLGVLLYELLTGTTPFDKNRFAKAAYDEIRRVIREEEPDKPSSRLSHSSESLPSVAAQRNIEPAKLSKLVRGDLDWITMKALEKDRSRRYETANGFAMDVQRYLVDEPVLACPPSAAYRLRKFVRRNRVGLAVAGLVASFLIILAGGIGWVARDQAARRAAIDHEVSLALHEALQLQEQRKYPEALLAAKRAEGQLAGGASPNVRARVREVRKDMEMVQRLEEIRLIEGEGTQLDMDAFNFAKMDHAYATAFRDYDIDIESLEPAEAADFVRGRAIRVELAAALDQWARAYWISRVKSDTGWRARLTIARMVDPDPWRNRLRDAYEQRYSEGPTVKAFEQLAASVPLDQLPASTLALLGYRLQDEGATEQAVGLLLKAHRLYPSDFWVNYYLASCYNRAKPPQLDEAVRFYTAALVLRPQFFVMHNNLGFALERKGRLDEATAAYREAIRLRPYHYLPHINLGNCLLAKGQAVEAEAEFREGIRLTADNPGAYRPNLVNLAHSYYRQGKTTEARDVQTQEIAYLQAALQTDPQNATNRRTLRDHYWVLAENANLEHDELAKIAEEFPRVFPDEQDEWFRAAWYLSRCVTEVQKDDNLPEHRRTQIAQRYAEQAVEMLRQSIVKGNKNVSRLKSEPVFAPLRPREDFQKLVAELEGNDK
jgi:serine/threonine protein kinase/tetratricopeptide (TPR) repeat protein